MGHSVMADILEKVKFILKTGFFFALLGFL